MSVSSLLASFSRSLASGALLFSPPVLFAPHALRTLVLCLWLAVAGGLLAPAVQAQAPTAAPVVTAVPGNAQVTLKWPVVSGATSYVIYQNSTAGTPGSSIATPAAAPVNGVNSFSRTGLSNGSTYYFTVAARNSSGDGPNSVQKSVKPVAAPVLATPEVDNNKVTLSWSVSPGTEASSFQIQRTVVGSGTWTVAGTKAALTTPSPTVDTNYSFDDTTALNWTQYQYKIQVANPVVNPELNAYLISNSQLAKPTPAPTITNVAPGSGGAVFTFSGIPVSTSYYLYCSTVAGQLGSQFGSGTTGASGTTHIHNQAGMTNGTTYYFQVRFATSGTGPYSNQVSCKPFAAPALVTATQGDNNVRLDWTWSGGNNAQIPGSTASKYEIYRAVWGDNYITEPYDVTDDNALYYIDTNASNGTTYKYKVRAMNPVSNPYLESGSLNAMPLATPNVHTVTPGAQQVFLDWDDITGATSYRIYMSTDPTVLGPVQTNPIASEVTIPNLTNGTTYYFTVQVRNGIGNGPSSVKKVTKPRAIPPVPTGLSAASGNAKVTLTWNNNTSNVNGADSYILSRGTSAGQTTGRTEISVPGGAGSTITYVDNNPPNGLTNGSTYYYTVKAVNTSGTSAASGEVNAKAVAPPAIPSVTLVNATGQVTLNWNVAADADSYDIVRSSSAGGTYTPLQSDISATGTTLSYPHTGLTDGTSYYYKVVANNAGGSTASAVLTGKPIAKPSLGISSGPDVYLWWNAAPGATQYDVYRGTSPTNLSKIENDLTSFSYTSSGLTQGDTYYYRLAAKNPNGVVFSDTVSAIPLMYPLSIPNVSSGQVTFNWAPAPGATGYEVRRGATYETASVLQATGPSRTFTETGLTNGTRYTYYIISRNSTGFAYLAIGVIPSASPRLRAIGGASKVTLDWDALSGATGYDIYRSTNPSDANSFTPVATNQTGTSYVDLTAVNGTTYYYGLVIYDAAGVVFSNLASATPRALPATPTGLSASAGNAQVNLTWTVAGDADSYKLYRSTSPTGSTTEITVPGGATANSYPDTGRSNGVTYYYTLKAFNTSGSSAASSQVNAKPLAPPSAPTLSGGAPSGAIALSWNSISGATYTVKRGTESGGPYGTEVATGLTATSYTDTGAADGVDYYYVVTATNAGGESANSNQIAAKKLTTPTLSLTGIGAENGGGRASLAWTAVTGATQYEVFRSQNSSNFGSTAYATVAAPALDYIDTAASNGQVFYYKVRATALAVNNSAGSLSAFVTASPLAAPVVTATAGAGQVTLTWPAVTGATSYQVFQSTQSGSQGGSISSTSGVPITGLDNGAIYYYQVRALNSTGTGPLSIQKSATPRALPAKPTGLSAIAANAKVTLTWNSVIDADSYTVFRSKTNGQTASGSQFTVATTTDPTVTYQNLGLDNGDTYYYTVKAVNTSGSSAASDQVSAKPSAAPATAPVLSITTGDDSVTLSWTVVTGDNISYRVQRSVNGGADYSTLNDVLSVTEFSDPDVENGSTYHYRVYATNIGGDGPNSNVVSGTPLALPAKVGAVTLTPLDGEMGISFAAVPTASSYRIYQSTTAGTYNYSNATKTVSGTGTISTSIDGLQNGTRYYYVVKAVNSTGAGAASDEVSAVTLAKPGKPVLNAIAGDSKVDLSWNPVAGTTFYTLKRGTVSGGPYGTTVAENIAATSATPQSYQDSTVQNGNIYYYVLTAGNASGEGLASDQKSAKPQAAPTSTPQNLLITSDGLQVLLTWDAMTGADGYKIYRTTDLDAQDNPVFGTNALATSEDAFYEDNDVEHGVTYYYQVKAYNGAGLGPAAEGHVTVYAHTSFDARIASAEVADWVGENIVNSTGVNQTLSAFPAPAPGQTANYRIWVTTNGGVNPSKSLVVTVPDWTSPLSTNGWTFRLFEDKEDGEEITNEVFKTNIQSGVTGWSVTATNGKTLKLRLELTAPTSATVGQSKSLLVRVTESSNSETAPSDTVKATATVRASTQPDLSVRSITDVEEAEPEWIGDGVIGGTNQKVSLVTYPGSNRKYELRIRNLGSSPQSFTLRLPAAQTGWTDKLFDGLNGTTEITTAAREETGWLTPELVPGAELSLRLEVVGTTTTSTQFESVIRVSSDMDHDQVKIEQLQQSIFGIQWSDDNIAWHNVTATTLIDARQLDVIGFRAVKTIPDSEWPESNAAGPSWSFKDNSYIGETLWLHAEDLSTEAEELEVGILGSSASAYIKVRLGEGTIRYDTEN